MSVEYLVNEHIKTLNSKAASLPKDDNAIRLDLGELPYPPSPQVLKTIHETTSMTNRYPNGVANPVRAALAKYNGLSKDQIIVGNGSDDLIELIVKVFVSLGEEVIIPIPTFFVYWRHATEILGGKPVFAPRTADFGIDVESLVQKATSPLAKVIFIANPNNPTGNFVPREVIVEILERVNCIVVVDECYYEMCQKTVVDLVDKYNNLIILRSLSKSFGLAGLRIGYGVANPTCIDYLYRATQTFPVNRIAQAAALVALNDLDYMRAKLEQVRQEREKLAQRLQTLGFIVYPSETNFLFVRTEPLGIPSKHIVEALRARNIFVSDFGLKPGLDAYYLKTAVGTSDENKTLLTGLAEIVTELSVQ